MFIMFLQLASVLVQCFIPPANYAVRVSLLSKSKTIPKGSFNACNEA